MKAMVRRNCLSKLYDYAVANRDGIVIENIVTNDIFEYTNMLLGYLEGVNILNIRDVIEPLYIKEANKTITLIILANRGRHFNLTNLAEVDDKMLSLKQYISRYKQLYI